MALFVTLVFALAALSYLWSLKVSYDTEGGAIGMVPVLGPPLFSLAPLATLGLWLLGRTQGWAIPWWGFLLCFLGLAAFGIASTSWIGRLPQKRREKH